MSLRSPERTENHTATPLPISDAIKPTPADGPRTERIWPPTKNTSAAAAPNAIQTATSLRTLAGLSACVLMVAITPNGPAQAGRGKNVQLQTTVRSRPGLQPNGWTRSYRVSPHVSLHILCRLQLCAAERTEDHRLLMKLPLWAAGGLVKRRHGPNHEWPSVAARSVKRPVVSIFQTVLQHLAAWVGKKHNLNSPLPSNNQGSPTAAGNGCWQRIQRLQIPEHRT